MDTHESARREIEIIGALTLLQDISPEIVEGIHAEENKAISAFYKQQLYAGMFIGIKKGIELCLNPKELLRNFAKAWNGNSQYNQFRQLQYSKQSKEISLSTLEKGLKQHFSDVSNIAAYIRKHPTHESLLLVRRFLPKEFNRKPS